MLFLNECCCGQCLYVFNTIQQENPNDELIVDMPHRLTRQMAHHIKKVMQTCEIGYPTNYYISMYQQYPSGIELCVEGRARLTSPHTRSTKEKVTSYAHLTYSTFNCCVTVHVLPQ